MPECHMLQFQPAMRGGQAHRDGLWPVHASCSDSLVLTRRAPDVTISSNSDFEEESSLVPKSPVPFSLGESPLTDPRSLGSSAMFHVIVVLLASLTALNVALPMAASRPKALYAEVDPVDNRADVPTITGPRRW